MYKISEGILDRVIRVVIGSISLLAAFFWLGGLLQIIAYVVGIIGLATGLVGYCGLYSLIGIFTCPTKK